MGAACCRGGAGEEVLEEAVAGGKQVGVQQHQPQRQHRKGGGRAAKEGAGGDEAVAMMVVDARGAAVTSSAQPSPTDTDADGGSTGSGGGGGGRATKERPLSAGRALSVDLGPHPPQPHLFSQLHRSDRSRSVVSALTLDSISSFSVRSLRSNGPLPLPPVTVTAAAALAAETGGQGGDVDSDSDVSTDWGSSESETCAPAEFDEAFGGGFEQWGEEEEDDDDDEEEVDGGDRRKEEEDAARPGVGRPSRAAFASIAERRRSAAAGRRVSSEARDRVPALPPSRRQSAAAAAAARRRRTDLTRFSESEGDDGDDDLLDLDETASRRLNTMIESGDFTYVTNTMGEIELVRKQAVELRNRLNLFYNPSLVRAVLEILKAKEIQVARAREQRLLDEEAFDVLNASIQEVRELIAARTNTNTVQSARRVFHRTQTSGCLDDELRRDGGGGGGGGGGSTPRSRNRSSAGSNLSAALARHPTQAWPVSPLSTAGLAASASPRRRASAGAFLLPGAAHPSSPRGSFLSPRRKSLSVSSAGDLLSRMAAVENGSGGGGGGGDDDDDDDGGDDDGGQVKPGRTRPGGRADEAIDVGNLLGVCVREAFHSQVTSAYRLLLRALTRMRLSFVAVDVRRQWAQLEEHAYGRRARLVADTVSAIERHYPYDRRVARVRGRARDVLLTVELMELQEAARARLAGGPRVLSAR